MRVFYLTSEVFQLAKTGGLADEPRLAFASMSLPTMAQCDRENQLVNSLDNMCSHGGYAALPAGRRLNDFALDWVLTGK
jgi:hypothetical protein